MNGIKRPFTRLPDAINFGPTGARLWATYIRPKPGFDGSFEFIHKVNCPRLFAVDIRVNGSHVALSAVTHRWYPSRLEVDYEADSLRATEAKFITWDDCAVSILRITNTSGCSVRIECESTPGSPPNSDDLSHNWSFDMHGATVFVASGPDATLKTELAPGESMEYISAAALSLTPDESRENLDRWLRHSDPLAVHEAEYTRFFDQTPKFHCSDPAFETMWNYRWYLVRRNLADPRCGHLSHPLFYEGRAAKMSLDAWNPTGWEFSRLIPFGTPLHLLEGRWHPNADACKGEVLNLVKNQRDDGLFRCIFIDQIRSDYTDFTAWAAWQLYLVHRDRDWLTEVAPGIIRQVEGVLRAYDEDGDYLPTVTNHGSTGKEYQPSFFTKPDYPPRPEKSQATPLERVDAACYLYMNADAASRIMAEIGDSIAASRMSAIASGVKSAILEMMWDPELRYFYDIDAALHDRIPVENVVGSDPFLAGIAGQEHLAAFDRLTDPEQLWSEYPIRSTTARNPVYAPDSSWHGEHLKGPHGCMWNGPTWPFTNSTILMALANATRMCKNRLDPIFADLLRRYTLMCFRNGNLDDPIIYEHYNPETGLPISQEEDYFHSTWLDLIISYVAGITPLPDGHIEFHPIDCGLDWFSLTGVHAAGHIVDVEYSSSSGYVFRVDGQSQKPLDSHA